MDLVEGSGRRPYSAKSRLLQQILSAVPASDPHLNAAARTAFDGCATHEPKCWSAMRMCYHNSTLAAAAESMVAAGETVTHITRTKAAVPSPAVNTTLPQDAIVSWLSALRSGRV